MTPKGAKVKQVQDDAMSGIEGQMVYAQRQQTRRDPSRCYFSHDVLLCANATLAVDDDDDRLRTIAIGMTFLPFVTLLPLLVMLNLFQHLSFNGRNY